MQHLPVAVVKLRQYNDTDGSSVKGLLNGTNLGPAAQEHVGLKKRHDHKRPAISIWYLTDERLC